VASFLVEPSTLAARSAAASTAATAGTPLARPCAGGHADASGACIRSLSNNPGRSDQMLGHPTETQLEFGHRCRDAGVRPSMGSVGDAYDNAMCESFFATLDCELLARCRFKTQAEARNATFAFIEGFYNKRCRQITKLG
jgi:integrase-like protein